MSEETAKFIRAYVLVGLTWGGARLQFRSDGSEVILDRYKIASLGPTGSRETLSQTERERSRNSQVNIYIYTCMCL